MINETNKRSDEIKQLIAADDLNRAINRLMDFISDFVDDIEINSEIILVSAKHKKFLKDERQNLLDFNTSNVIRSRLISHILQLHNEAYMIVTNRVKENNKFTFSETEKKYQKNIDTRNNYKEYLSRFDNSDSSKKSLVLSANSLLFRYEKANFKLHDISLTLKKNEILGVVGENGQGKTTLLNILAGELKQDRGIIQYPFLKKTNRVSSNWINIKRNIAFVKQEIPDWYGCAIDNLYYQFAFVSSDKNENKREVNFIVHRLGLTEHINKKWHQLSGGYKLRFALAKALLKRPKLIILDEPLANLDVNAQAILLDDLKNLVNSVKYPISLIISSQHIHEIEYLADKILFIKNGSAIFYGDKSILGKNRKYNYYEIQSNMNKEVISEKLCNLNLIDIVDHSIYIQIITPLEVTSDILIQEMLTKSVTIKYFRDVSNSTKKLFI